jgi:hypothetical protein
LPRALQLAVLPLDIRLCSFDVKDVYTNIPQQDTTHIIYNILSKENNNLADDV